MRTLIVEDELTSLKMLESYLKDSSEVDFATDANQAFDLFVSAHDDNRSYDLICLDINMPNGNGIELLAEIRDYEEANEIVGSDGVRVFMVTGHNEPQKVFDSFSKGCTAFFTKPVDRQRFLEELKKVSVEKAT